MVKGAALEIAVSEKTGFDHSSLSSGLPKSQINLYQHFFHQTKSHSIFLFWHYM